MAKVEDLPKLTEFDAGAYSDKLQETRVVARPVVGAAANGLPPALAFDKANKSSIVPFAKYVKETLYSRVQALIQFTADQDSVLTVHSQRLNTHADRISVLEDKVAAGGGGIATPFLADS